MSRDICIYQEFLTEAHKGQIQAACQETGFTPHFFTLDQFEEAKACLDETQFCYGDLFYFRGGGYSAHLVSRGGMPVTLSRLNLVDGLGPVLQIAEGWTCDVPKEAHDILDKRTDPTWPTTWFAPRSRTSTPSWRTGARTTAPSATATSART